MDDTCTAIHQEIDEFHKHLNSIETVIQFTKEIQQENKLPFLDIHLTKEDDGTISTSVYCKKTHTDQYLHFSSHHQIAHKQAPKSSFDKTKSFFYHNIWECNGHYDDWFSNTKAFCIVHGTYAGRNFIL